MANLTALILLSLVVTFALHVSALPEDPTAESLSEIDANEDSDLDASKLPSSLPSESQDTSVGTDDLSSIDADVNGMSDSADQPKLLQVPGSGVKGGNATAKDVALTPKPMVSSGPESKVLSPTHPEAAGSLHAVSVSGLAAEKPSAKPHVILEADAGIQEPIPTSQRAKTPEATNTATQVAANQSADIVKAAPVDPMVKGSAQEPHASPVPTTQPAEASQAADTATQATAKQTADFVKATAKQTAHIVKSSPGDRIVNNFTEAADTAKQAIGTQSADSVEAADTAKEAISKQSADIVDASPVNRMVKHFAQVLRTAEVVPMQAATSKLADTGEATKAGSTDIGSRADVQSAAKEVSEQLSIAELAEAKARVLDRQAAEQLANATVLAKQTAQEALNAGAAAAHLKANELLARISKLEDQAERADVRSAALHSKAKLEIDEASELMAVADRAVNHGPVADQALIHGPKAPVSLKF